MTKPIIRFKDGEANCTGCGSPLPATEIWPGHKVLYCQRAECKETAARHPYQRYIEANTIRCKRLGCEAYIPAGCYDQRHTNYACSSYCWRKLRSEKTREDYAVTCACGCGETFVPFKTGNDTHFLNREHAGKFRTDQALRRCGIYLPIVREYLEGFALIHYAKSSRGSALTSLVAFCEFLLEVGVSSMNDVVPKVITDYLVWGTKQGRNQVAHSVSPLSTFFNWQIAEGRRILPNPIVPSIHKTRRNECEPRPFSSEEIDFAWELLQKQGDARIRLAMAIGLESGLRIGEIANIRLQDVDRVKQRIYVRTPTKTRKTRQTPFGEKTSALLDEWMAERDPNCGHDHLLCNKHGGPATAQSLRFGFTSALTKLGSNYYSGGPEQNDDGFDEWHTHRLRHTMSSNLANGGADVSTVMAIGGWSTFKAMSGYTKIDDSVAQSGYEAAMKKAKEQLAETKPNLRINLSDLAKKKQTSGNP